MEKYEEWNKKQEELFNLFFDIKNEDTINFKALVESVKPINQIWQGLYNILKESIKYFDNFSQVDIIKQLVYKNKNYLVLKLNIWNYIVIDLEDKQTLSKEQVLNIFEEEFFVSNFKEKCGYKLNIYYDFDECSIQYTHTIIEYYNKFKNVLDNDNSFIYSIKDNECRVYISIDISNFQIILGFNQYKEKNVNYIFINKDLKPIGASNPTDNNESLIKMGSRVCEIEIPKTLIPKNLLRLIYDFQKQTKILSYK